MGGAEARPIAACRDRLYLHIEVRALLSENRLRRGGGRRLRLFLG
jgi:hypothetical protein